MRILAGEDDEFLGKLECDEAIQVGYLAQEPVLKEETSDCKLGAGGGPHKGHGQGV